MDLKPCVYSELEVSYWHTLISDSGKHLAISCSTLQNNVHPLLNSSSFRFMKEPFEAVSSDISIPIVSQMTQKISINIQR